ncbi:unnamed protein product, partial [Urochloa humidicola]
AHAALPYGGDAKQADDEGGGRDGLNLHQIDVTKHTWRRWPGGDSALMSGLSSRRRRRVRSDA